MDAVQQSSDTAEGMSSSQSLMVFRPILTFQTEPRTSTQMLRSYFSYHSPEGLTRWARVKRRMKQVLPVDRRRIHAYNIGLERTGTHYIARLFSKYRAWHEPDISRLRPFVAEGESPTTAWFRSRDRALRLEVESSHVLRRFASKLVQAFPGRKFLCTVRDPVSWVQSVWRWSYPDEPGTRVRTRPTPSEGWKMWHSILGAYYDETEYRSDILKECGLYPMKGYFLKYKSHYRDILESVPSGQLLVIRTSSLSEETRRIAEFLDIEVPTLTPPSRQVNKSEKESAPFDEIDEGKIRSIANEYCESVWGEIKKRSS